MGNVDKPTGYRLFTNNKPQNTAQKPVFPQRKVFPPLQNPDHGDSEKKRQAQTGLPLSWGIKSVEQLLHFVQKLTEQFQSLFYGFGRSHIHASDLQQGDGILAAAGR